MRIGDLDASTAAQQGPFDVVTDDANVVLGKQQVATAFSMSAMRADMNYIAAVTDAQFEALSGEVAGARQQLLVQPQHRHAPGRTALFYRDYRARGDAGPSLGRNQRKQRRRLAQRTRERRFRVLIGTEAKWPLEGRFAR